MHEKNYEPAVRVGALDGAAPDFGVGDFDAFPSRAEVLFSVFLAAPSDFAAAEDSEEEPEEDSEEDSEEEPDEPDELDESDDEPADAPADDFEASARLSLR
ncbi:hypothetical protein [Frigoribacterium sp. CG_9.8]|uniref:hypothetical protein n=1 Tax=Frigoribacterium sp. CG_9.8 TaxID=2787733 RepID=UPI001A3368CE|nr:hypothetical protein [Frigoribacterium sp. CG_9.8]